VNWSLYGDDLPQLDNRRSNALERAGQTIRIENEQEEIDHIIEGFG